MTSGCDVPQGAAARGAVGFMRAVNPGVRSLGPQPRSVWRCGHHHCSTTTLHVPAETLKLNVTLLPHLLPPPCCRRSHPGLYTPAHLQALCHGRAETSHSTTRPKKVSQSEWLFTLAVLLTGLPTAPQRSFSDMNAAHPRAPASASSRSQGTDDDDGPPASPHSPFSHLFNRDSLTPPLRRFSASPAPYPAMAPSGTPPPHQSTTRHDPQNVIDLTLDDSPAARPPRGPERSSRARHEPGSNPPRRRLPPTVIDLESPDQATNLQPSRPVPASRDASVQTTASVRPGRRAGSRAATATNEDEDGDVEITSWTRLQPTIRPRRNTRLPPPRNGSRGQAESGAPETLEPATSVGPSSYLQTWFGLGNFAARRFRTRATPGLQVARPWSNTGAWMERIDTHFPQSLHGLGLTPWDYGASGFEDPESFFAGGEDEEEESSPQLEALPPVRDGFTRELNEGDELVCPNCDRELAAGDQTGDGMVWVVRACGHVYCGACGDKSNRVGRGARAKGKGRAKEREDGLEVAPLIMCVVDKCASRTTGEKSMFPLYL